MKIKAHLGDIEWVEGTYPTPIDIIAIKHKRNNKGQIESTIDAPDGIRIIQ